MTNLTDLLEASDQSSIAVDASVESIFDEVVDRKNSCSMKWSPEYYLTPEESAADPLPMWVADMDFKAPQAVLDALTEAVEHGVFGYTGRAPKSYVDAIVSWQGRRFGWDVSPQWIVQTSGVITTIKTAIQAFSAPGESVLIQPPVYVHFHDDVRLNGRHLAYAPLELDGDRYIFDAAKFERSIRKDTKLFILSNPHNPTGNVWSEDELRTMGEICARHGVIVVSDEIHQDFILNPSKRHTPFASLGGDCARNSIICTAPSKTFNMPGLQAANIIVPNHRLREQLARQYNRNVYSGVNTLGMVAAEAAYNNGEGWLEDLLRYVKRNQDHLAHELNAANLKIKVLPTDALYLAWIDCRELGMDPSSLSNFMLTHARVWLDRGDKFGTEGNGFMRANLGCSRSTVDDAIQRIKTALTQR